MSTGNAHRVSPATAGPLPSLLELGERICILGPSNSGKSTLAERIAQTMGMPAVHLDRYYHVPGSDWVPRPAPEFTALHDEATLQPRWVMDGNYSSLLPQRLQRATGLIVLDASTAVSLVRYVRRCLMRAPRAGALEGGRDSVKLAMLWHIAGATRRNRARYRELARHVTVPAVLLISRNQIQAAYQAWGLGELFRSE